MYILASIQSSLESFLKVVMSRIEDYFPKCTDTIHHECTVKRSPPTSSASAKKRPKFVGKGKRPVGRPRKKQPEIIDLTSEASLPPAKKPRKGDKTNSSEDEESESKSSRSVLHRMYSPAQKKAVATYARFNGVRKAARKYRVHHRNVQRWLKEEMQVIKNPKKRRNQPGQGKKITYPQEVEDQLLKWILEKREKSYLPVSRGMIRLKARTLIQQHNPQFTASEGWLQKFMRRHKLVLRCRTTLSQTLPCDLETKITAFHDRVRHVRENSDFPFELIANMDETPVYLDMIPSRTVNKKGKRSILVRSTNSEKRRITAVMCCNAAGKFLPTLAIFKGKTLRALKGITPPHGIHVRAQKNAWIDKDLMLYWIQNIWKAFTKGRPSLLILDRCKAHLEDSVKDAFQKCNTTTILIPGGCTSVVQPLDVSLNKPIKDHLRSQWTGYMIKKSEESEQQETPLEKIPPPSKQLICEWLEVAVSKLSSNPVVVKKSFQVTGISNALGAFEDELIRNDALHQEINEILSEVFGDDIIGYSSDAESEGDPFASTDSD